MLSRIVKRVCYFIVWFVCSMAVIIVLIPEANGAWASYDYDGDQSYVPATYASAELTVLPVSGVRLGTEDFIATRILAKSKQFGEGNTWLEVGYVYHGLQGFTEVYTYDTDSGWHWYPWFQLDMGDHIVVSLAETYGGWVAYLNYGNKTYTLAQTWGAGPRAAYVEHYVERHRDERHDATGAPDLVAPVSGDAIRFNPTGPVDTSVSAAQTALVNLHFHVASAQK